MRTLITPERAATIMEQNIINRKINQANVDFLVDQMNDDQFVFNGESIIISNEGHLLDGQHRLMACIKSNKPIEVSLVEVATNCVSVSLLIFYKPFLILLYCHLSRRH